MIKGDINNLVAWLNANNINYWCITAGGTAQSNNKIFESDIENNRDREIARMREVLSLSEHTCVYIAGRQNKNQQTGNYSETWCNKIESTPTINTIGATPQYDEQYIQNKIDNAVRQERLNWLEKELEKREKDLAEEKKAFRQDKEGVFGILVEKAAPVLAQFFPRASVAGIAQSETQAQTIRAVEAPADCLPQDTTQEDLFTEDESEQLYSMVAKFKEFDPDYLSILSKFISLATSGQGLNVMGISLSYDQVKKFILDS
ncbi:MAG: hypothetical protein U0K53_01715 [Paludibacteraceae bacterium]|nr:hypothetical protein [Paludibacteraceae bacterium]